jgi:3-isopropylmalate/(R)-2-methylmalate dehydratase small subunit
MRVVHLPVDDIDTDQIIPARFLKGTTKAGLGVHLFADWPDRPQPAEILVAGVNFGCGSSREHAAWALTDFGFRAIVARSFADIFRENAFKNGLLAIELPDAACRELVGDVTIDLAAQRIGPFEFAIDPFAKHCLLTGLDELGYLLSHQDAITAHERRT